ncbi:hypothetical protein BBOR36S_02683 [Brevibacillus borstelensis]|jgi:hypothetical protein
MPLLRTRAEICFFFHGRNDIMIGALMYVPSVFHLGTKGVSLRPGCGIQG